MILAYKADTGDIVTKAFGDVQVNDTIFVNVNDTLIDIIPVPFTRLDLYQSSSLILVDLLVNSYLDDNI